MARRKQQDEKIIHVVFGPGGGRLGSEDFVRDTAADGAEAPVSDLFTRAEVSKLLAVSATRLRSLDKNGLVSPTGKRRGRRAYTFTDLIALRAAQALLAEGVSMRAVSRAIETLRRLLPSVRVPLVELRVMPEKGRVVVRTGDGSMVAETGQMVLDLEVKRLEDDVVRVLRPHAGQERARMAFQVYLQASQLDEDEATMDEAERLYEEATRIDPWLAIAYTNRGNIAFRRRDVTAAEELYRKALTIDARQPEAQYNLGYVMLEMGRPETSIPLFLGAISSDPRFADAHFNLAMAYEQLGQEAQARAFWKSYVDLEPQGTWADIARRHL